MFNYRCAINCRPKIAIIADAPPCLLRRAHPVSKPARSQGLSDGINRNPWPREIGNDQRGSLNTQMSRRSRMQLWVCLVPGL